MYADADSAWKPASCQISLALGKDGGGPKIRKGSLSGLDLHQESPSSTTPSQTMVVSMLLLQTSMKPEIHVDLCSLCSRLMPWQCAWALLPSGAMLVWNGVKARGSWPVDPLKPIVDHWWICIPCCHQKTQWMPMVGGCCLKPCLSCAQESWSSSLQECWPCPLVISARQNQWCLESTGNLALFLTGPSFAMQVVVWMQDSYPCFSPVGGGDVHQWLFFFFFQKGSHGGRGTNVERLGDKCDLGAWCEIPPHTHQKKNQEKNNLETNKQKNHIQWANKIICFPFYKIKKKT